MKKIILGLMVVITSSYAFAGSNHCNVYSAEYSRITQSRFGQGKGDTVHFQALARLLAAKGYRFVQNKEKAALVLEGFELKYESDERSCLNMFMLLAMRGHVGEPKQNYSTSFRMKDVKTHETGYFVGRGCLDAVKSYSSEGDVFAFLSEAVSDDIPTCK